MKQNKIGHASREGARTGLAVNSIGFVEACECGVWHVHVGAITLRLNSSAVSSLLELLGSAVAEHAALGACDEDPTAALRSRHLSSKRGQA